MVVLIKYVLRTFWDFGASAELDEQLTVLHKWEFVCPLVQRITSKFGRRLRGSTQILEIIDSPTCLYQQTRGGDAAVPKKQTRQRTKKRVRVMAPGE